MINRLSSQLCTVITSFPQFSNIELIFNDLTLEISKNISQLVMTRLNEEVTNMQFRKDEQINPKAGKIIVLIIDRSFDPLSPALRDFFYQPMLYDIKQVQKNLVEYKEQNKPMAKKSLQNDVLFDKYRFTHLADAMQMLSADFQRFCQNNHIAQYQKANEEALSFDQMNKLIKNLPEYQELLQKYQMHNQLLDELYEYYNKFNLKEIGDIEQTLATGITENGEKLSTKQMIQRIQNVCQQQSIQEIDKQRLILIAIMQIDLSMKDRENLTNMFKNQSAFQNLVNLGVQVQNSGKKFKSKKTVDKKKIKATKNKLKQQDLQLCRTSTEIEGVLEYILTNNQNLNQKDISRLPEGFSKYKVECTSDNSPSKNKGLKSMLDKLNTKENNQDYYNEKTKLIVFFAGGISQSEIRAINHTLFQYQNISLVTGGTSFNNPTEYFQKLQEMTADMDN